MTQISGWGRYPKIEAQVVECHSDQEYLEASQSSTDIICHAAGRSYGDSALNAEVIKTTQNNAFLDFDEDTGLLYCESGATLAEIIEVFVPRGWFLKVTPGTKFVTVGGAIASDVHGKNHHIKGCFSNGVESLELLLPNGEVVVCSANDNQDFFQATCGGMGLTGVILRAKISLQKISSQYVNQKTIKCENLEAMFRGFEQVATASYSVAWIDCLASGSELGKGLVMSGEFSDDGDLGLPKQKQSSLPFEFPRWVLNPLAIKAFNWLYFNKVKKGISNQRVSLDTFFYPLDHISGWNKMYGRKGFLQYQFILPLENSLDGMKQILTLIGNSKLGSFLAVLKLYGESNDNWLSFPMKGYSLALDFKYQPKLLPLLDKLDQIVMKCGGRIYLAKDARVNKSVFQAGYPKIEEFRSFRKKHGLDKTYNSIQSKRLEI